MGNPKITTMGKSALSFSVHFCVHIIFFFPLRCGKHPPPCTAFLWLFCFPLLPLPQETPLFLLLFISACISSFLFSHYAESIPPPLALLIWHHAFPFFETGSAIPLFFETTPLQQDREKFIYDMHPAFDIWHPPL